jgi:hypothetical protein
MARPKKKTVDYFPHKCVSGKTIFILEQEFGNDGYAFWFKLLEQLGSVEGHYIDCKNSAELRFLQAKTRLSGDKTIEILNLLAELEAIDPELWSQKVIWSQNFVDGIAEVYINRRVEKPSKPSFYTPKPPDDALSSPDYTDPTAESTQSRLKEIKGKETKENNLSQNAREESEEKPAESPNTGSVPPEDEQKSTPLPPSATTTYDGLVVYDAEAAILANEIEFEQVCMKASKPDLEAAKTSLRKYHLFLTEREQYPKGRKAVFAGFEKWLLNEDSFKPKTQKNGNYTAKATGGKPVPQPKAKGQFGAL